MVNSSNEFWRFEAMRYRENATATMHDDKIAPWFEISLKVGGVADQRHFRL
jgi:hypothetical protein